MKAVILAGGLGSPPKMSPKQTRSTVGGYINMNALLIWGLSAGGLLMALFLGQKVAQGDYKPIIGLFVIGVAALIALSFGKNYWILIPIGTPLVGSIGVLPIPFSYSELAILGALSLYVLHLCFHRQYFGFHFKLIDWLLLVNLLVLLGAYIRNPAGLLIASSEIIGSRQYFTILLGIGAYVVLAHSVATPKLAKRFAIVLAIPMILAGTIDAITSIYPSISKFVWPFYSAVNLETLTDVNVQESVDRRITGLADVASPIMLLLCSMKPPIAFLTPVHPISFFLFLAALIMIGLSGFRSVLISSGAFIALSTLLWGRMRDLFTIAGIGFLVVLALIGTQSMGYSLPLTFQRAMSFIPFVQWDPDAIASAEESSEWRYDMWKEALSSNKYIRNKTWGDGLGFRLEDFLAIQRVMMGWGGALAMEKSNEAAMIKGSFHSGPISTIRVVGYVGLIIFLPTLFAFAFAAAKIVQKAYKTPFFSWSLFLAIPLLYFPFEYIFIFGDYKDDIYTLVMAAGYLKLFDNSFSAWKTSQMISKTECVAQNHVETIVSD